MSSQPNRLAKGGMIDRSKPVRFSFDGEQFTGFQGDTLASALLANGMRLVGRSFKYHRPRGILTAGSEEPNALVELRSGARREPNTRATTIELYDGLAAASQNCWPSLRLDLLAANQIFSPIFGAGFYYKTFMWPAAFWEKLYEPAIRRAAGLGRAAEAPDPDHYEKTNALLRRAGDRRRARGSVGGTRRRAIRRAGDPVRGGFPPWRAAARGALRDRRASRARLGGGGRGRARKPGRLPHPAPHHRAGRLRRRHLCRDRARQRSCGQSRRRMQPRQRLWRIVAKRAVLAAGAIERPIVFGNNDRPGVMLAGAVRAYVNRYGVTPGRRAVIFADNDDAFRTAEDLAEAGVTVAALIDARKSASPRAQRRRERRKPATSPAPRSSRCAAAMACAASMVGDASGKTERFACDLVAVSGGWNPTVNLTTHLNGKPQWSDACSALVPGALPPGMSVAGAAPGLVRPWRMPGRRR